MENSVFGGGHFLTFLSRCVGMREVKLGKDAGGTTRPMINGKFRFLAGFLDQSYWPDGIYLAPGDEALASDVTVPSPGSQTI